MTQCKTTGFSAGARKNHCATVFKKSMIVYGGQTESGVFYNEMIVLHLEYMEWMKIQLKSRKSDKLKRMHWKSGTQQTKAL